MFAVDIWKADVERGTAARTRRVWRHGVAGVRQRHFQEADRRTAGVTFPSALAPRGLAASGPLSSVYLSAQLL